MRHGAFVAIGAVAVVLASVTTAWAAFPGRNGLLAVGGEVVNPDGTGRRPFVPGSGVAWSADGMRVAFNTSGGYRVAGADGSDVRVVRLRTRRTATPRAGGRTASASCSPDPRGPIVLGV